MGLDTRRIVAADPGELLQLDATLIGDLPGEADIEQVERLSGLAAMRLDTNDDLERLAMMQRADLGPEVSA